MMFPGFHGEFDAAFMTHRSVNPMRFRIEHIWIENVVQIT